MTDQDRMCGDRLRDCYSCPVSEHSDLEKGNDRDDGESKSRHSFSRAQWSINVRDTEKGGDDDDPQVSS